MTHILEAMIRNGVMVEFGYCLILDNENYYEVDGDDE